MGVGSEEVIAPSKGTRIRYPLQNEIKKIERNPKMIFENILKHAKNLFCDVVIFGQKNRSTPLGKFYPTLTSFKSFLNRIWGKSRNINQMKISINS